jgi:hypothetical protein
MLSAVRRRARYALHNVLLRRRLSMLEIDPQDIRYVQFPELWTYGAGRGRPLAVERRPGDWDRVEAGAQVAWSGRYEDRGAPSRMVPIEQFGFYEACLARFRSGASWSETGWYRWLIGRIEAGERVRRYESLDVVQARLAFLDRMYADIAQEGYRSARARQDDGPGGLPRWLRRPPEWDEPVVNLGREGRIAIEDGRHRLCLARIAGAPRVRVRVGAIHPDSSVGA